MTGIIVFIALLQLILISGTYKTLHLSPLFFAIGSDNLNEFAVAFQALPLSIMYTDICKDGVEGTTFAALTSITGLAYATSFDLGMLLASVWDVKLAMLLF